MSKLRALGKHELVQILRGLGEEPHPKWTVPEIRSRIKELEGGDNEVKDPLKGMTSMTKEELKQLCGSLNVTISPNDTKGTMMRKLRLHQELTTAARPSDFMGFGRHTSLTYLEVAVDFPTYVQWAIETVNESKGDVDPRLERFATWVAQWKKENVDKKSTARSSRRTTTRGADNDQTTEKLMATIEKLSTKIEQLETKIEVSNAEPKTKVRVKTEPKTEDQDTVDLTMED